MHINSHSESMNYYKQFNYFGKMVYFSVFNSISYDRGDRVYTIKSPTNAEFIYNKQNGSLIQIDKSSIYFFLLFI